MVFKPFKGHFLYSGARSSSGGGCMRGAGCWYFVFWKCVKKGYSSGRIDLPVPPNCLSIIITGTYFSPFQGVLHLSRGLSKAPQPYFCIILEFWIIFFIFYEWIILLNILDSIEWIFFWMNILDFVLDWILNWIIFRPDLMKKWIFKTSRPPQTWKPSESFLLSFHIFLSCKTVNCLSFFLTLCPSVLVRFSSPQIVLVHCRMSQFF